MSMVRIRARVVAAVVAAALSPACAAAQAPARPSLPEVPAPPQPTGAIRLQVAPDPVRAAEGPERWVLYNNQPRLIDVAEPTLTPVLPARGKATGAAVIIAPGGGFVQLAIEKEGWAVARRLADEGVAAFVLKYRLRPFAERPRAPASGGAHLAVEQVVGQPAYHDAVAAMRLVRSQAARFGVDPERVGMMGFSAGASLSLALAGAPERDVRPAFVGAIYSPMRRIEVAADAPPLFAALAADDALFGGGEFGLVQGWRAAGRPVELHLYEAGGHGFGVPGAPGTTTTGMMDQFLLWLRSRGLLTVRPR